MNVFEFVLGIVLIATIGGVLKSLLGGRRESKHERRLARDGDSAETAALRDEVKMLKDRLAVLERITVEKENSLEREIEALRDR